MKNRDFWDLENNLVKAERKLAYKQEQEYLPIREEFSKKISDEAIRRFEMMGGDEAFKDFWGGREWYVNQFSGRTTAPKEWSDVLTNFMSNIVLSEKLLSPEDRDIWNKVDKRGSERFRQSQAAKKLLRTLNEKYNKVEYAALQFPELKHFMSPAMLERCNAFKPTPSYRCNGRDEVIAVMGQETVTDAMWFIRHCGMEGVKTNGED